MQHKSVFSHYENTVLIHHNINQNFSAIFFKFSRADVTKIRIRLKKNLNFPSFVLYKTLVPLLLKPVFNIYTRPYNIKNFFGSLDYNYYLYTYLDRNTF